MRVNQIFWIRYAPWVKHWQEAMTNLDIDIALSGFLGFFMSRKSGVIREIEQKSKKIFHDVTNDRRYAPFIKH